MKPMAIGIDIGGTNTKFGLVDHTGHVLFRSVMPTRDHDLVEDYVADLAARLKKAVSDQPHYQLTGIGIGAPNANFYKGTIEHAPNLPWKGIIPFADLMKEHYDLPVFLTNDANAAAIGEMIYGGAKTMKNFIVITLGTGLGSGIVVNGNLVYGHDGMAGEIGHTLVDPQGRECGCGRTGCLETYASATGIVKTVFELLADCRDESELRDIPYNQLTSKRISEAALAGDPIAQEAFDQTGEFLGLKLADSVAHLSPQAIFLFGGLAQAGDLIFQPVKKYLEMYNFPAFKNKVKLLPSEIAGADAAILGASALVWKEVEGQ